MPLGVTSSYTPSITNVNLSSKSSMKVQDKVESAPSEPSDKISSKSLSEHSSALLESENEHTDDGEMKSVDLSDSEMGE